MKGPVKSTPFYPKNPTSLLIGNNIEVVVVCRVSVLKTIANAIQMAYNVENIANAQSAWMGRKRIRQKKWKKLKRNKRNPKNTQSSYDLLDNFNY